MGFFDLFRNKDDNKAIDNLKIDTSNRPRPMPMDDKARKQAKEGLKKLKEAEKKYAKGGIVSNSSFHSSSISMNPTHSITNIPVDWDLLNELESKDCCALCGMDIGSFAKNGLCSGCEFDYDADTKEMYGEFYDETIPDTLDDLAKILDDAPASATASGDAVVVSSSKAMADEYAEQVKEAL